MRTTIVSQTSSYIAPVLPIILCAPKFLDGSMTLGEVMQAASAFTIVQGAFNWLVDNYPQAGRLDRVGAPRRLADGVARRAGARRERRRRRPHRASAETATSAALRLERSVGHARRRHRGGRRHRRRDHAGRARADRGRSRAPARARWCARSPACGRGAAARSRSRGAPSCSCCRSGPTSRSARCAAPRPIRTLPTASAVEEIAEAFKRVGLGASHRPARGGGAVGPDAVRRREAAARFRPHLPAQARTSSCWTRRPPRSTRRARTS